MSRQSRVWSVLLGAGLALPAWTVASQSPEVTQALEFARASKQAGRPNDAIDALAAVLKKFPGSADASRLQIETLFEVDRQAEALKVYDAYAAAQPKADPAVLGALARSDLRRTARVRSSQPQSLVRALERLAREGDADALQGLRQAADATSVISPDSLAPVIALARVKDPAGETRLVQMLGTSAPLERAQVVQAIGQAALRSQAPRVLALLGDPDLNVRNAAAVALGLLQDKQAVPQLRNAFQNDEAGSVKLFAAVALRQLGDASADTFLEDRLKGQIAELQVIAAGAWQFATSRSPVWEKAVRTLLGSANELHRLKAAELLACCDRVAARNVLTSALASPNPLLRAAAAAALEARPELADLALARRLLGDAAESVRIHGAGLALTISRSGPAKSAGLRGRGTTSDTSGRRVSLARP